MSPAARSASASSMRGDAQPVGAGLAGGAGHRDHAVAVAVGLDDGHHGDVRTDDLTQRRTL